MAEFSTSTNSVFAIANRAKFSPLPPEPPNPAFIPPKPTFGPQPGKPAEK